MSIKNRDILENLTIDEELLAELQSRGVITSEIADNIRCRPVDIDKNRYLCSFIYQQPKPQLDVFIDVLKNRSQDHVVKFIGLDPDKLGMTGAIDYKVLVFCSYLYFLKKNY